MSAINVNSITGRTGTHGPVLTGVTTVTGDLHVGGGVSFSGITTVSSSLHVVGTGSSIGVGTDDPRSKLDIQGSDQELRIYRDDGTRFGGFRYTGAIFKLRLPTNDPFTVDDASDNERFRVNANGQVKIGGNTLVAPDADADNLVIDTGDVDSGISILSATTGRIYFGDAGDHEAGSIRYVHTDNSMRFETANTERIRVGSAGSVHIGDNTSNANGHGLLSLTQNASAAFNALAIQQGNTGFNATDGLHIGIDAAVDAYFKLFENRDFIFYTGTTNTEKLRLTSAGRLGIGTDNPDTNVTLLGNTDGVLNVDTTDNRGAFMRFRENGTSKAWVGCSEGIGSGGDQDDLGLRAVDNIRFRAGDNFVTINNSGNILMGDGAGIDFSATGDGSGTMSSELLDDYEEGTFEPIFTSTAGAFNSVTYNSDTGARYTKVGSLVTVTGCARCSAIDTSNISGGSTLCIGGLPFTNVARTNGDNADNIGSLRVPVWGNTNNCPHAIQARQNQTFCTLLNYEIDAVTNTNIVSQANNSMMVQFSLQYTAA
jgi:hypothetical protein